MQLSHWCQWEALHNLNGHPVHKQEFSNLIMFNYVSYPSDHGWFVAKMNMSSIIVLDFFGGAKTVALKDYFKAKPYWVLLPLEWPSENLSTYYDLTHLNKVGMRTSVRNFARAYFSAYHRGKDATVVLVVHRSRQHWLRNWTLDRKSIAIRGITLDLVTWSITFVTAQTSITLLSRFTGSRPRARSPEFAPRDQAGLIWTQATPT